jgi:hypothetical protein
MRPCLCPAARGWRTPWATELRARSCRRGGGTRTGPSRRWRLGKRRRCSSRGAWRPQHQRSLPRPHPQLGRVIVSPPRPADSQQMTPSSQPSGSWFPSCKAATSRACPKSILVIVKYVPQIHPRYCKIRAPKSILIIVKYVYLSASVLNSEIPSLLNIPLRCT